MGTADDLPELMAAFGAMLSAGSAGVQKYTAGDVDWSQVGVDALIGAGSGGVGGAAAGMALGRGAFLATASPTLRGAGVVGSAVTPPGHVSVYIDDPKILQDAATKFKFSK